MAESAQPFFSNLRMAPPETPAGANLFLGELEFRKKCCAKPIDSPRNAQHFTSTSHTPRIKKGDSEEPPFTSSVSDTSAVKIFEIASKINQRLLTSGRDLTSHRFLKADTRSTGSC